MNKASCIFIAALSIALAACDKRPSEPPKPETSAQGAGSSGGSVAAPSGTLPPSDATIKSDSPTTSSGNANTPTQANPSNLSKAEEQSSLPHSGQVNNHSVPETVGEKK